VLWQSLMMKEDGELWADGRARCERTVDAGEAAMRAEGEQASALDQRTADEEGH